ncbi:MAG: 3-deoxy-D-manno-octulosonic acid transferase [Sulfitobacter sp.]
MARSLGLAAYRALARRGTAPQDAPDAPRPEGELIWIHAGEVSNLLAVHNLAGRLVASRPELHVLITLPETTDIGKTAVQPQEAHVIQIPLPREHPTAVNAFLDHWKPDAGIWVWGGLRPNLILEAQERGISMMLIDAESTGFDKGRSRWLPDVTRRLLTVFSHVFARSAAGHKRLVQMGLSARHVRQTSPLLAGGRVLPYIDSDLTELANALGGRPTWLATHVLPQEITTVLNAHMRASRLSHRLLLILQPASAEDAATASAQASALGLSVASWAAGQYPDEITQVLVSDDISDCGLFFRVAPVSFLGSTLLQSDGGCDPMDAAALGSAILYGPKVRHFMQSYSRLAAAGAARIVNDADALGAAVSSLIAPDHAAAMAHAGWDVISEGAELTDRVTEIIHDTLDLKKGRT